MQSNKQFHIFILALLKLILSAKILWMNNKLRKICILSILLATNVAISSVYIPITLNLQIEFTFVIMMYIGACYSLPECIIFAILEDLITYFLFQAGRWPFFPGYTLSAVIGVAIYWFFLHKKVSLFNIAVSKTLVNIIVNVGLGSLWNKIMYGNAFLYYAATSIVKNLILLPFEILFFYIIYKALLPVTNKYLKK